MVTNRGSIEDLLNEPDEQHAQMKLNMAGLQMSDPIPSVNSVRYSNDKKDFFKNSLALIDENFSISPDIDDPDSAG